MGEQEHASVQKASSVSAASLAAVTESFSVCGVCGTLTALTLSSMVAAVCLLLGGVAVTLGCSTVGPDASNLQTHTINRQRRRWRQRQQRRPGRSGNTRETQTPPSWWSHDQHLESEQPAKHPDKSEHHSHTHTHTDRVEELGDEVTGRLTFDPHQKQPQALQKLRW